MDWKNCFLSLILRSVILLSGVGKASYVPFQHAIKWWLILASSVHGQVVGHLPEDRNLIALGIAFGLGLSTSEFKRYKDRIQ